MLDHLTQNNVISPKLVIWEMLKEGDWVAYDISTCVDVEECDHVYVCIYVHMVTRIQTNDYNN